jgi:hypothetical protein
MVERKPKKQKQQTSTHNRNRANKITKRQTNSRFTITYETKNTSRNVYVVSI